MAARPPKKITIETRIDPEIADWAQAATERRAPNPHRPAEPADRAAAQRRLFGIAPTPGWADSLQLQPGASVRDLYRSAARTEAFRAACGRISASYAW